MKILITGATGFIGCRMAERFNAFGHDLVLLGRIRNHIEKVRAEQLTSLGLSVEDVDLSKDDIGQYTGGVHTVIHLAAAQHESNMPESYFEQVNVNGTRRLLDAAVEGKVDRFIYGSTIGVYGAVSDFVIDDASPAAPDNCYERTKFEAETVVSGYRDRLKVIIARISETYGPGDKRLLKLFAGIEQGLFFMIGKGANRHQLVYVDDLVMAFREMISNDAVVNQALVIAGDEVLTTRQMCTCVSEAVGKPLHRVQFPLWPFTILAIICEQTLGRLGLKPPLHRRRLDFFRKSLSFSSKNRNKMLKWRPSVSFAEGTAKTSEWYRENQFLPTPDLKTHLSPH